MRVTPDTPLLSFFEDVFRVERLRGKNQRYIDTYPRAIEWLLMTLDRDPLISDLTSSNIRRTMRTVADCGNRRFWIDKMRTRLCSLWRYAQRIGVVDNYQAVPMAEFYTDRMKFLEGPPPDDSLRAYYAHRYRRRLKGQMRQEFDTATRNLDKHLGRYAMLEEIDHQLILEFSRWLTKHRKSRPRVDRYCSAIRQVVRAWDPTKFPPRGRRLEPLPIAPEGSVRWLFETQYVPQQMLDCAYMSVVQARSAMRRLFVHYGRDIMLSELDDALAADHLAWLKHEQKLQAVSVNAIHRSTLFAVWRFAVTLGLKDRDPRIRKLKELRHSPDSWDIEDVRKLVRACEVFQGQEWKGAVPLDLFWRALLLVEWWTGLRARTLLAIRMDNVDVATGWIRVEADTMKNRHGRKFRIGPDAIAAVKGIWEPRRERLFEWPYRMEILWKYFRTLQAAAGLPESKRAMSRFHKLRRSTATAVASVAGISAAASLLDHSSDTVTRRYVDESRLPGQDVTEILPALFESEAPR